MIVPPNIIMIVKYKKENKKHHCLLILNLKKRITEKEIRDQVQNNVQKHSF